MNTNKENLNGWKSDTLPLPKPIEMEDINEDVLIIKRKDEEKE